MSLGIKRTRPQRVAMRTVETTPAELPLEFENLFSWARRRNLRVGEPDLSGRNPLPWVSVVHSETEMAAETPRRFDLWIPIEGAGASQPGYLVKDVGHENVAFVIYKGAMSKLDEAVEQHFAWAQSKQLAFRGRLHRRIYLRGIDGPPEDPDWEAEIQIPLLAMRN
jgi:DNA gyrase inhibitor GyrI